MFKLSRFILFSSLTLSASAFGQSAADIRGFAPVSVSSANYATTSRDRILESVEGKNAVNPPTLDIKPLSEPVKFVFMPGEVYESDVTYEEICELLTPSLAAKNYINGADKVGIIKDPSAIKLVLRVNFGVRTWRLPKVRTESLTWRDGMQPRARGRSLTTLGGDVVFDNRSGGDDDALAAAGKNETNTRTAYGSTQSGASAGTTPQVSVSASTGVEYGNTRNFNLIVIDAFDYQELKTKSKSAKRLWTTFVASPVESGKSFATVVDTLIRSATAHWGETTPGMQVFTDSRAEVKIGEAVVVPDEKK
ncbi:MAG TPA: hypothetical protein PLN52_19825 [Opitutaceae bacterium]|nr:hypothetical protein [Opitutaceae bacterium]